MARLPFHLFSFFVVLALATAVATADNDDVQQRQEGMLQALGVVTRFNLARTNTDAEAVRQVKRALAVLNREVEAHPQRWKTIFNAVDKAMDSGADDRSREEASSVAKELLEREFGPTPTWLKRVVGDEDL
ncbi:uncharacterized protein LOC123441112 [Hordeum vulgare subsp. vulgare]|uniref:Predicted protein n=1 Tax=Hordeum vulgare subsp. vulgare TaxID=112509 RepID=F2EL49_HORVV|nr:uncharacterized protein LOC123441112 [Hordeum vulgare subsp. vulgare]BAK08071.1 predicted protein [Hordeum vulgare subsp. vulgare]